MSIEPVFEKLSLITKKTECESFIDVSEKATISIESIDKVLSVSVFPTVNDGNISNEKLDFNGRAVFYVCFSDKEGDIKKYECAKEFSGSFDNLDCFKSGKRLESALSVEVVKCDYVLGIGDITLRAKLKVKSKVYLEDNVSYLSGGAGLITNSIETKIDKSYGLRKSPYSLEEEFSLNYQVKEVLSQSIKAVITATQCGVGCIIVDGEIIFSALLLQNLEKSDIIRENKTIPFRFEIEYEEAMPNLSCTAFVIENSLNTDVQVDGESGKSLVKVKAGLRFYGEVYSEENILLVCDAFNKEEELQTECEEYSYAQNKCNKNLESDVCVRAEVEELPAGVRLTSIYAEDIEIVSKEVINDKINISGIISAIAYLKDVEGAVSSIRLVAPFSVSEEYYASQSENMEIVAIPKNLNARIVSLSSVELSFKATFNIACESPKIIKYLKDVKCVGEKEVNDYAFSVFIAQENEELWSLAKRLNVCPEELIATNKELQFPLSGKERIVIYRQKK